MGRLGLRPQSNETAVYYSTCRIDVVESLQVVGLVVSSPVSFSLKMVELFGTYIIQ
jgi:hypothetical protein